MHEHLVQIKYNLLNHLDIDKRQIERIKCIKVIERPFSSIGFFEITYSGISNIYVSKTTTHHPVNKSIV